MDRWVTVGLVPELQPGTCRSVDIGDLSVALCNVDGRIYALDNVCPHAGGPLGEGTVVGDHVECPWHGWRYNVRTGERPENPDFKVPTYRVQLEGNNIQIFVPGTKTD
ncbi:MAG: Rieske (2Fe-2S) protein [Nitrospirales bacterium]